MKLTVGKVLELLGKVGAILVQRGVMNAAGDFVNPVSAVHVAQAASDIEQLLAANGVVFQGDVKKAIEALPVVLPLLGLK